MNEFLKMLSLPFGAELNLNIPEQSLEKVIQEYAQGKVEVSEFHCMDGYFGFYVKKGILPRMNIQLGIEEIVINSKELIVSLSDRVGNLSKLVSLLSMVGVNLPLKTKPGNLIQIDVSHHWQQQMKTQPDEILQLLETLQVNALIIPTKLKLIFTKPQI